MTELESLLSESNIAALRGCTVRTLQRERAERRGPPFIRLGRRVFHRPDAVNDWLCALKQTPVRSLSEGEV